MDDDVVVLSSSSASTRHSCKVCGKGFACGRSLGGHMRSHSLAEVETAAAAIVDEGERRWMKQGGARCTNGGVAAGGGGGGGGYGLRENPKKTRRLSGSVSGGGDVDDDGDGDLLSPPSCRPPVRSSGVVYDADVDADNVGVDDNDEDLDRSEATAAVVMAAPRRRPRTVRVPTPAANAFDGGDEPEDVARCLMMLSQDTRRPWNDDDDYSPPSLNYYHHHSDDDNFELSLSSSHHRYATETEINKKISKRRKKTKTKTTGPSFTTGVTGEKRGRYECPGCGRAFQSYQALGGHRASHKRINSNCSLVVSVDQPEQSIETNATSFSSASTSASLNVTLPKPAKKPSKFVCPICYKEFGSGQALGGHKRSHTIAGEFYDHGHADREGGHKRSHTIAGEHYERGHSGREGGTIVKQEECLLTERFLDLNLPAPGGDDG